MMVMRLNELFQYNFISNNSIYKDDNSNLNTKSEHCKRPNSNLFVLISSLESKC